MLSMGWSVLTAMSERHRPNLAGPAGLDELVDLGHADYPLAALAVDLDLVNTHWRSECDSAAKAKVATLPPKNRRHRAMRSARASAGESGWLCSR